MPSTTATEADVNRLYSMIDRVRTAQEEIVAKLARIDANLAHTADLRGRVEILEKESARRAGVIAVIAAIAGAVSAIGVSVAGYFFKTQIGI